MRNLKSGGGLMNKPYLKAIPDEDGDRLHFVMDQAGFSLFERLLARSAPTKADSPVAFNEVKDRVSGAFYAGAVLMGWKK